MHLRIRSTYSNAHIIGAIADSSLEMPWRKFMIELAVQESIRVFKIRSLLSFPVIIKAI